MWDVAIVGAGPAGSAAALAALRARPDARVLLLDRSAFPRDKACGDGIASHALDVLSALGVSDATAGYRAVPDLRLGFAGGPAAHGTMRRPAYVIPREVFDARLVAAALAAGATFRRHRVRQVELTREGVILDGQIAARTVVAADGANSDVRRCVALSPSSRRHVALAIRGYAPVQAELAGAQVLRLADRGWPAYGWSFPIGNGQANVGYGELLTTATGLGRNQLLTRLEALIPGSTVGGSRWRAHHLPLSSGRPRQPDGPVLLAGDAASLINPLTGEGIFHAILSGALAGRVAVTAAAPGDAGRVYRRLLHNELGRHLRHTKAAAEIARSSRLVRRIIAAAGAPPLFDDLVELGLGRGLLTPRLVAGLLRPSEKVGRWRSDVS